MRLRRATGARRALRRAVAGLALVATGAALLAGCGQSPLVTSGRLGPAFLPSRSCVYSDNSLRALRAFDQLVLAQIGCAVVFADAAPNWAAWERPWFIGDRIPDGQWAQFGAQPGHQLIITINLLPTPLTQGDWRAIGAAGGYAAHARALAQNLIAAGLGGATIRLGHEANGTWYPDNVGTTPAQWSEWKRFWRATVLAMLSVPGAHFSFNWCIAAGYRAIPFSAYYPGDDVVDSIGVDIYDMGVPLGQDRWTYQEQRAGGVGAIVRFARAHRKPLSIPEWGLAAPGSGGAGDDPAFTDGIANLVATAPVNYQAYFFAHQSGSLLTPSSRSLGIYTANLLHP